MGWARHNRPIILDWVNVTYRSVVLTVAGVVLAAVTAGGWWYYSHEIRPKALALSEIAEATARVAEAGHRTGDDPTEQLKALARESLDGARAQFEATEYREARRSAEDARRLALQALERLAGAEAPSNSVGFAELAGDVRVKLAGEFAWIPADRGMKLKVGDQVKTAKNGSAKLVYFDRTETTIDPGSLLEIRDLYEDPVTKVRRVREKLNFGAIEASTQAGNVRGSYHELATDNAAARATEAGEYRVVHAEDGPSTFSAFRGGDVEIATATRKIALSAGERIAAGRGGSLAAKEMLPAPPRLVSPQDEKVISSEDPSKTAIALSWEKVPGIAKYRLEIATDSLFAVRLHESERTGTSTTIVGPEVGSYYWRVASVSGSGNQSRFSEARRFRVTSQRIRDRGDTEPPELEITEAVLSGPVLIVNGRTEPGATLWIDSERNEVDDDGQFYAVVKLSREGWNEITFVAQDAAGNETRLKQRKYVETY